MRKKAVYWIVIACIITLLQMAAPPANAMDNTVSFNNRSGDPALVKLIGPTYREIEVADGSTGTVSASGGNYYILVRYGTPGQYRYSKGQSFQVVQTPTTRSRITITLHKVVGGNYSSQSIGPNEFNAHSN